MDAATKTLGRVACPLKWHGGKTYLAEKILSVMPPHLHYVEPFFGGGAVLFRKPCDGKSEVVNDIYGELINFWRIVQSPDQFTEFVRRVSLTPFAKPIWERSTLPPSGDSIGDAVAFFVRYRQSRQGLGKDFATMTRNRTRRGMNEQVSSWLSAVDGLPEAHDRLKRVVIYCEDASSVIRREDGENTLFYLDPPYMPDTRVAKSAYRCEMTHDGHAGILELLGSVAGNFVLSGYRNEIYDDAAARYGWSRSDIAIDNKASSQKTKPIKTECLWMNY